MTPRELAEIEGRNATARAYMKDAIAAGVKPYIEGDDVRVVLDTVDALVAEVRRLTPAVKVARWEAGVDDYEDCTVLCDPATNAVLGWYNRFGLGECIWGDAVTLFPGAKNKIAEYAKKNGWEVRDGE